MPLLTVVFLASYGLMTLLIVEQGEAIESQTSLIRVLQTDSRELWAQKTKALIEKRAQLQAQASSVQGPSTQGKNALNATPSTQAPSNENPSTQVPQRSQNRAGNVNRPESHASGKTPDAKVPPMPASDLGDERRALFTL